MSKKVLYIEDNKASGLLVKKVLSSYTVDLCDTALAGIDMVKNNQYDLILIDIQLPDMNGRELTTTLRNLTPNTPLVALTAHEEEDAREMALVAGCNGFLKKPINVQTFQKQIDDYLAGKQEHPDNPMYHLEKHAGQIARNLEKKVRQLEIINQKKTDFILLISHELRTPLALVMGYASMLQETRSLEYVDLTIGATSSLNQIINDLIQTAAILTDELYIGTEPVQLKSVVDNAIGELDMTERDLHITSDSFEGFPFIEGDSVLLTTAIKNILSNAVKYTPDGGNVSITASVKDRVVLLKVTDTGQGINSDKFDVLFEPFFTLNDVKTHTTSKTRFGGGGLGLGLTITQGIVKAHRGNIWLDSKEGVGTTVYIELPVFDFQLDTN